MDATLTTTTTTVIVVVGIDIGSESTKVVLGPKFGGCEIVRNNVGGHTTPTAISFAAAASQGNNHQSLRHIGATAAQSKTALKGFMKLLHDEFVSGNEKDQASVFGKFDIEKDDDNNDKLVVKGMNYTFNDTDSSASSSTKFFSGSECIAMLLGHIQTNVHATLKRQNNNTLLKDYELEVELTVGPDMSDTAKEELLDAVYASGISKTRLVESSTAYHYCYQRKFPESTDHPKTVLVVDMGKTQTTVTVLGASKSTTEEEATTTTTKKKEGEEEKKAEASSTNDDDATNKTTAVPSSSFQVLSSVRHKTLGAGFMDLRLWEYFHSNHNKLAASSSSSTLTAKSKSGQRLLQGCSKLKHLLSQLSEGSVTVENILEDVDITLSCSRQQFQDLCGQDATELTSLIQLAMEKAEISTNDHTTAVSIEVTGGGCRIPWVKDTIVRAVHGNGKENTTVLAFSFDDTSAALGAALYGQELLDKNDDDDASTTTNIPETDLRKQLRAAEEQMKAMDEQIQQKAAIQNQMEAHILELRSAKHDSKYGKLIQNPDDLDKYLNEVEDWLFSEQADNATKEEMEAKWQQVLQKTNEDLVKDYLQAKLQDQQAKDAEMEAQAKQAQADAEGEGDDDEDHDNRRLPKKRRMEIVMKNKAEANELFGDGNFKFAAARYTKALSHCAKFVDLNPDDVKEVNDVKLSLNLNLALAYIKLQNFNQALRVCNDALALDNSNTKALYRRASVHYEMKQWDLANKDIKSAVKLTPEDKAIKKLQQKIDAQLQRQKLKEKKMAQKMFG